MAVKDKSVELSVVIPVYGGKSLLPELYERLSASLSAITKKYEIVLVNDRCPQGSWETIEQLCKKDKKVVGVNLSRNFGQQYALNAGLDQANGEWVVTMDCDLQDSPEEIDKLYEKAREGFDIVFARRKRRKDNFIKKIASRLFYGLLGYLTGVKQDSGVANFVLYNRKVVDALFDMKDYFRYYPVMLNWIGFKSVKVDIRHAERKDGRASSYRLRDRFHLAFNVIVFFSDKALRAIIKLGLLIVFVSFLMAVFFVVKHYYFKANVPGWTSLFLSLWFLSGILVVMIGLVGVYVGKIFENTKHRPRYIIDDVRNGKKK